jgi:hypothetical protein
MAPILEKGRRPTDDRYAVRRPRESGLEEIAVGEKACTDRGHG